jgi:hypothetical protein
VTGSPDALGADEAPLAVTPSGEDVSMQATPVLFATTARVLGGAARARGWAAPGFRSPPRSPGAGRTLRRGADGSVTVAVRLEGRPWLAVVADMIEGIVVANDLADPDAGACRTALWDAVDRAGAALGPAGATPGGPRPALGVAPPYQGPSGAARAA